MSALTDEAAWFRKCAADPARPPAERALFDRMANQIEAYLANDPDIVQTPSAEDAELW